MSELDGASPPPAKPNFIEMMKGRMRDEGLHDEDGLADMEVIIGLMRLSTLLTNDFEALHRPHGFSWAGFRVMTVLWVVGELEPSEIARLSFSTRASISSIINTLEDAGFVTRRRGLPDRRHILVSLTDKGLKAIRSHTPAHAERERAWLAALTKQERATFLKLVWKLVHQPHPNGT